ARSPASACCCGTRPRRATLATPRSSSWPRQPLPTIPTATARSSSSWFTRPARPGRSRQYPDRRHRARSARRQVVAAHVDRDGMGTPLVADLGIPIVSLENRVDVRNLDRIALVDRVKAHIEEGRVVERVVRRVIGLMTTRAKREVEVASIL